MDPFEALNALGLWDFKLDSLRERSLTILASNDFDYYHQAEIRFEDVTFIECAEKFSHAVFRRDTVEERRARFARLGIEGEVFCIRTEAADGCQGSEQDQYFVVARRASCAIGTVYYCRPDHLEPGERIATWVR
jgi:hypothetical protein